MSAALSRTEKAHQKYRDGEYLEALNLYTSALCVAKLVSQRIALYSNRAACHLKLKNYSKAADECGAVLYLDDKHVGALSLRAQAFLALKDYYTALVDVNRLLELDPTSDAYRRLQDRLKTQISMSTITEANEEEERDRDDSSSPVDKESSSSVDKESSTVDKDTVKASESLMTSPPTAEDGVPESKGSSAIPKPSSHSNINYSRWDNIAKGLSSDEEDDDKPRFRYRVKSVNFANK